MSETLTIETHGDTQSEAPADRYADVQFGDEGTQQDNAASEADSSTQEAPGADQTQAGQRKEVSEPEWYVRRIGSVTAKRREAEERAASAERERDELRRALAASRGEAEQTREPTADEVRQEERARYEQRETQQRASQEFGAATARVADSIAALYGRDAIAQATASLSDRVGLDFSNRNHQQVILDISELPNAGAVYYALANDPNAASELLDAPERKQYALLQKFAASVGENQEQPARQAPPAQVSKAPPPVAAAAGSGRAVSSRSIYDEMSDADYFAMRDRQKRGK